MAFKWKFKKADFCSVSSLHFQQQGRNADSTARCKQKNERKCLGNNHWMLRSSRRNLARCHCKRVVMIEDKTFIPYRPSLISLLFKMVKTDYDAFQYNIFANKKD